MTVLILTPAPFLSPLQAFLHRIRQTADDQQCLSTEHVKVWLAFKFYKERAKSLFLKWFFNFQLKEIYYNLRYVVCLLSPMSLSIYWSLPCPFPSFQPDSLSLPSSASPPLTYPSPTPSLFLDSVFKYWGHPGVAQRGAVCGGVQSAAGSPSPACTGTRVPAVCK